MRSFPYQPFDVQYRRGKEIPLADALSRVTPTPVEEDGIQLPIVAVNLITSNIPVSSTEIELICVYHLCGWVPGSKIIKANLLDTTLLRHL